MKSVSSWKKPSLNNPGLTAHIACLLVLFCFNIAACQNSIAIPDFDPNGKMLFVEEVDGNVGTYNSWLGEIVIYDPATKRKHRMTKDRHYDAHPYWSSNGQKVIFESKRIDSNSDRIFDQSDMSHLFVLDIKNGRIVQFDKNFVQLYGNEVCEENALPAWSPVTNKIAFLTRVDHREKLVLLDTDQNMITELVAPGKYKSIKRMQWSSSGDYLAFEFHIRGTIANRGIAILNVQTKQIDSIEDSLSSCSVGGWRHDANRLWIHCNTPNQVNSARDYEYSLESRKRELLDLPKVGYNGQFGLPHTLMVFIEFDRSTGRTDIWKYDDASKNAVKLTSDGLSKHGLMWYVAP